MGFIFANIAYHNLIVPVLTFGYQISIMIQVSMYNSFIVRICSVLECLQKLQVGFYQLTKPFIFVNAF